MESGKKTEKKTKQNSKSASLVIHLDWLYGPETQ